MSKSKKYYVVRVGRERGIFDSWEECKPLVDGFQGAVYRSFKHYPQAEQWYEGSLIREEKPKPRIEYRKKTRAEQQIELAQIARQKMA